MGVALSPLVITGVRIGHPASLKGRRRSNHDQESYWAQCDKVDATQPGDMSSDTYLQGAQSSTASNSHVEFKAAQELGLTQVIIGSNIRTEPGRTTAL